MVDIIDDPSEHGDLEIAKPEDFAISRDEDGDLVPLWARVPGRDSIVEIRPMSEGAVEAKMPASHDVNTVSNEQAARIIDDHLITPDPSDLADGDELTAEDIETGFVGYAVNPLLMTILEASGYDMFIAANYNEEVMDRFVEQFLAGAVDGEGGLPAALGDESHD